MSATRDDCEGGPAIEETVETTFSIMQDGNTVSIIYDDACAQGTVATGTTTSSGAQAIAQWTVVCGGGSEAVRIQTLDLADVSGDQGEITSRIEVDCPEGSCVREWRGTAMRTTPTVADCAALLSETPEESPTPSPTPTVEPTPTPSETPTPTPTPEATVEPTPEPTATPAVSDCSLCDLTGCCSSNGGVNVCLGNGPVACADGTTSPTCTCFF